MKCPSHHVPVAPLVVPSHQSQLIACPWLQSQLCHAVLVCAVRVVACFPTRADVTCCALLWASQLPKGGGTGYCVSTTLTAWSKVALECSIPFAVGFAMLVLGVATRLAPLLSRCRSCWHGRDRSTHDHSDDDDDDDRDTSIGNRTVDRSGNGVCAPPPSHGVGAAAAAAALAGDEESDLYTPLQSGPEDKSESAAAAHVPPMRWRPSVARASSGLGRAAFRPGRRESSIGAFDRSRVSSLDVLFGKRSHSALLGIADPEVDPDARLRGCVSRTQCVADDHANSSCFRALFPLLVCSFQCRL